ncbi:MAG: hypothetical protein M3N53_05765 [Actinomycetota bacterium]|nr:hypothetical protein [Actinomycetota bacterium]
MIERRPVLFTFLIALAVRLGALAIFEFVMNTESFALDDSTYSAMATAVVEGRTEVWDAGTRGLFVSVFAFTGPLSVLYSIFGTSDIVGQLYVALLGAGTAALVTALGREIFPDRIALIGGVALAFLPSQVVWSALLLKDTSVWIVLAALAVVVAVAGRKNGASLVAWGVGAAVLLFILGHLRGHTTVVAAWAIAAAAFAGTRESRWRRGFGGLVIAVATPWLIGLGPAGLDLVQNAGSLEYRRAANAIDANSAFVKALGAEERGLVEDPASLVAELTTKEQLVRSRVVEVAATLGTIKREISSPKTSPDEEQRLQQRATELERRASRLRQRAAQAREERERLAAVITTQSHADDTADAEQLAPDLIHLPKGILVMLFEPVPWETSGSQTMRLARTDAVLWYPLLALALPGLWAARRYLRVLAFPILVGGGMLLTYALTEGNIGTAFRHRGEFVWVVALLATLGLVQVRAWWQRRSEGTFSPAESGRS